MGLFRRKSSTMPERPSGVAADPFLGDEPARVLKRAAVAGDWHYVRDFLAEVSHPDDRAFYIDVATDLEGPQHWIQQWAQAEPTSGLARLVWGSHDIVWAWEARTGNRAQHVSQDRFQVFFDRLRVAENHLDEATELDPDDAIAWTRLITCAMGRQLGVPEATRRFKAGSARDPWNYGLHHKMMLMLCRKWFGSHEQMHDFADQVVAGMPSGSPLGDLVAKAQYEHWVDLDSGERDEYLARPAVAASLAAAANKSIRHPLYVKRPGWPTTHSYFAMAFTQTRQYAAALEQFEILGDIVAPYPWGYLRGTAGDVRDRFRTEAIQNLR